MTEDRTDVWTAKVAEKLKEYKYEHALDESRMQDFFDQREDLPEEKRSSFRWVKLAAVIALLFVAGMPIYLYNGVSVSSELANTHRLPDGSQIELRPNTEIEYNKIAWYFTRKLALQGEAYFDVRSGSTFSVHSSNGSTSVLGTRFSINTTNGLYEVKCYEGKVSVESLGNSTILTEGKGVSFMDVNISEFSVENEQPDWVLEELTFEEETIEHVMMSLQSIYHIEFEVDGRFKDETYTGFFPTNDLDLALKLVFEPIGMEYSKVDERTFRITRKAPEKD